MFQYIVLDLRVGCPILKFGHIHIFQRELNPNLFRVDLALGKQDNRLDSWLTEQIAEANENGYTPDENVEDFIGKTDYYFTVSKGNEEEGFDSYGFACRPFVFEEDYDNGKRN